MFWVEGKAWAEACKSKCECVFRSDCSRPPNREVGQEVTWRVWAGTRLERTGKPFSIVFTSCCKKWEVGNYLEQVGQDWTQCFRNLTLVKFSQEGMESEFAIRGLLQQCRWEKVEPCLTDCESRPQTFKRSLRGRIKRTQHSSSGRIGRHAGNPKRSDS